MVCFACDGPLLLIVLGVCYGVAMLVVCLGPGPLCAYALWLREAEGSCGHSCLPLLAPCQPGGERVQQHVEPGAATSAWLPAASPPRVLHTDRCGVVHVR